MGEVGEINLMLKNIRKSLQKVKCTEGKGWNALFVENHGIFQE